MMRRLAVVFLLGAVALSAAPSAKYDVPPPGQRAPVLELAKRLARPAPLEPLPADLPQPFNPPGFEQPDASERRTPPPGATPSTQAVPVSDREMLERIADRIRPSGIIVLNNQPALVFRQKRLNVGDHLIVTLEKNDYDVVISAIDPATYTLRLNRDEITRSLKPGKSP
jgi:hypothetical protein